MADEQVSDNFPIEMHDFTDPQYMQTEPTGDQKSLYDLYVLEFLKDWDWHGAAVRVGFHSAFVDNFVENVKLNAYVNRLISRARHNAPKTEEKTQLELDKELVLSTLRQAAQNGPFNTRVAAAGRLAQIQGLDKSEDPGAKREEELIEVMKSFASKVQ